MDPLSPLFIGASFFAGVLMFLAPCTLPLIPAYLALISGVDLKGASITHIEHTRIIKNAAGFVIGFSLVFILLGAGVGYIGGFGNIRALLTIFGGVLIITLAFSMLGWLRLPFKKTGALPLPKFARAGNPTSAAFVGILFALGWTPCVGPVLGSVLLIASSGASAGYGVVLLSVFALGMALPFLLVALLYVQSSTLLARYSGVLPLIHKIGAVFLIVLGVLMLSGDLSLLVTYGTPVFYWLNLEWIYNFL